ncbi:thioredoxin [Victivallaceae bacterium BBE-744-WT-12]|jgi:thioredoxin|uniref:Thioredoxin n=1 Tax=Victivallis lenta TaxID=2606640 RepID=A0A844FWR0_9BACT|nr:thioredoxin [Victivallis lenta]MBS5530544.1 thioredoxin [bacterium]MST95516.1 thioredoxin [Victivallis lenta]HBP06919.1 thioredoxin [Lentisphaeria bacterium]HCH85358.1 thioredoxin [Lentisphaeria bacterium]
MAEIKELNAANFDETVKSGVVLVDFWAPWCNPCRMLGGILEQVAAELPADVTIGKVNIDENRDLAVKFEVMNIPRIFIYKDGKIVNDMSGVQSKPKLLDALKNA